MSPCEIATPGQRDDVRGSAVGPEDRLLSVAEIQRALRELRAREPAAIPPRPEPVGSGPHGRSGAGPGSDERFDADGGFDAGGQSLPRLGTALDERWVAVVAAHAGAGASSVALAIADAAAPLGRPTHVVETADPTRSGLVGAASVELGVDPSGAWRRGSRGQVTIHRRADAGTPSGWPAFTAPDDGLVVVDLGLPTPDCLTRLAMSGCRVVVVCRPTVPGVRLAEQLLNAITGSVIIASVGCDRWPGEVRASLGPRLGALRAQGAVVTVPADRRLAITGPTTSPLPKPVAVAGRMLLGLIDADYPGAPTTTTAQGSPRRKGTDR